MNLNNLPPDELAQLREQRQRELASSRTLDQAFASQKLRNLGQRVAGADGSGHDNPGNLTVEGVEAASQLMRDEGLSLAQATSRLANSAQAESNAAFWAGAAEAPALSEGAAASFRRRGEHLDRQAQQILDPNGEPTAEPEPDPRVVAPGSRQLRGLDSIGRMLDEQGF